MKIQDIVRTDKPRCGWAGTDPLYIKYHDLEWGFCVHGDEKLFANLILDGFQAGLSWITILRKRENFRLAFNHWDIPKIGEYDSRDIQRLMSDPGIIRNQLKIEAAIVNARCCLEIQKEFGSFDEFLWSFTKHKTIVSKPRFTRLNQIPTCSPESDAMSRELKKRGFKFVGSTMCYAFMQAVGMVDDHLNDCFRSIPGEIVTGRS